MEKTRGTVYRPVGNADIARKEIFDLFNTTYSSDESSYSDKFTDMRDTFNSIFIKVIDKRATGGSFRDDVGMKDTRPTGDDILAKLVDLVSRHVNTVVYYTRDNPTFRYYTGLGASGKDKRIDTSFDLLFPLLFMKLLVDKPGK